MKKRKAGLIFIGLIIFTAAAWCCVIQNHSENKIKYDEYLDNAEAFEEKGIYIDALDSYENILKLDPRNYEIVMKKADMYYKLGDYYGFIDACNQAISIDNNNAEAYVKKTEYYISEMQYSEALKVIDNAGNVEDDRIKQLQTELSSKYIEKYVSFSKVNDWHVQRDVNYNAACESGKWGIVLKDGTWKIRNKFDYLGAYDEAAGVIPCCEDGQYYYIDTEGNKKLAGDNVYQYLGSFGDGLAPAQRKNLYGYIDTHFREQHFDYEYAGAFANNIAAVKKDGKWALIDNKFNNITEYEYDEILVDSNGFCAMYEVIIARRDDKYVLLGHDGKQIGNRMFDGARLAASDDGYIAVKIGDRWGFSDIKGNLVINAQYDDARSFSLGLAPIEIENKWGYINTSGEVVIETKYSEAGVFSIDGAAPVKSYDTWNFIVLCEYDD